MAMTRPPARTSTPAAPTAAPATPPPFDVTVTGPDQGDQFRVEVVTRDASGKLISNGRVGIIPTGNTGIEIIRCQEGRYGQIAGNNADWHITTGPNGQSIVWVTIKGIQANATFTYEMDGKKYEESVRLVKPDLVTWTRRKREK